MARIKKVDLVLDEKLFKVLLSQCIRGHRFGHDGADPKTVVVPKIGVVEGITIVYKESDESI